MKKDFCLFCLEEKDLKRSHAIGNTIFRRVLKECDKNAAIRISLKEDKLKLSNDSWASKQLCGDCEQFFNQRYEAYSINALRGKVEVIKKTILPNGLFFENIDTKKIACYFLSIYWRGAHSSVSEYKELFIKKGLDEHLIKVFSGKSDINKLINIRMQRLYDETGYSTKEQLETIITTPFAERKGNNKMSFNFIFEGYFIEIYLGKLGYFDKKKQGFIDVKKDFIFMPFKDFLEIKQLEKTFLHGVYLNHKDNSLN
ncbi:hypothetical protein EA770_07070 [Acinetobacter baumannii]|nr:hypothetical protein EA770_07070 [Acinetobacter baumannii]